MPPSTGQSAAMAFVSSWIWSSLVSIRRPSGDERSMARSASIRWRNRGQTGGGVGVDLDGRVARQARQVDDDGPRGGAALDVVPLVVDLAEHRVGSLLVAGPVGPRAGVHGVVATLAVEAVDPVAAREDVVVGAAQQRVVTP